jgi:ribosomal protein S12
MAAVNMTVSATVVSHTVSVMLATSWQMIRNHAKILMNARQIMAVVPSCVTILRDHSHVVVKKDFS